jgi:hypothetical protein
MPPDNPPRPGIAFDVSGIDFGQAPVGFTQESSIIITNHGEIDLTVDSIVPDHGSINIVESFPQTLAPWTTSTVTVQFSPAATGVVNAYAVISSNDPDAPTIYFPVDGEGVPPIEPVPDVKINGQDGPLSLTFGTQATLSVDLIANDYLGQSAEFWISAQAPFGLYWLVEGTGWVPSATPVAFKTDGIIADQGFSFDLGDSLPIGSYVYEFSVDNIVNGTLDQVWVDTLDMTIEAADPIPDIMVNGQDGPMAQDLGAATSLNVSLSPGGYQGEPAELWISAQTPVGLYWYVAGSGWVPSSIPVRGVSTAIAEINHTINLGSRLPRGGYRFEFTVDNAANGALDSVWTDSVTMFVQ